MNRISQAMGGCDREAIAPVVRYLLRKYRPSTVVDYGCGDGAWLAEFVYPGARTIGIDRTDRLKHFVGTFIEHDLLKWPIRWGNGIVQDSPPALDMALCLEVAEHLPRKAADGLLDQLSKHRVVVFSAAIPGQGGLGHVNEQWQSWWAERFAARGMYPETEVRDLFWDMWTVPVWYRQNLLVYTREAKPLLPRDLLRLDVVHPDLWLRPSLMGMLARLGGRR